MLADGVATSNGHGYTARSLQRGASSEVLRKGPAVLVADNDLGTRHGIRLTLETAGLYVCAEAGDARAVTEGAMQHEPDVALVDLKLPGGGLRAGGWVCRHLPQTAVVFVADEVSDDALFDALRMGAAGFVHKGMNHARLPHVLRGVLRGEAALSRELVGRLAHEFRERGRRRYVPLPDARGIDLTTREWDVLDLIRQRKTTRDIAERLGITQVTVRRHIGEILKKLHVDSRAAALDLLEKRSGS